MPGDGILFCPGVELSGSELNLDAQCCLPRSCRFNAIMTKSPITSVQSKRPGGDRRLSESDHTVLSFSHSCIHILLLFNERDFSRQLPALQAAARQAVHTPIDGPGEEGLALGNEEKLMCQKEAPICVRSSDQANR